MTEYYVLSRGRPGNPYAAGFLTNSSGSPVVDPTYGQQYTNSSNKTVIGDNFYKIYDAFGSRVANGASSLIVPEYISTPQAFADVVNAAASLPMASRVVEYAMAADYKLNDFFGTASIPSYYLNNIEGYVLFGPGNPQKNPSGVNYTNEFIQPFTGGASYLFGSIAAARPGDGLAIIEEAGYVNSKQSGANHDGFAGNPAKNTVEFLAGIQAVTGGQFAGIQDSGSFPFAYSIGLDNASATAYFNALKNGNSMWSAPTR